MLNPLSHTNQGIKSIFYSGIKRRVSVHNLRYFLSRVGLFCKLGLLPWCSRKPPSWSLFLGLCKEDFTHVITKKCQRGQKSHKETTHLGPLDSSWQERLANVVTPVWRLSYEEQLKVKFEAQNKILQRLESCLIINRLKVTTAAPKLEGLFGLLHAIIPSPVINGLKKSTLSVNRVLDGNPKMVGYYLGNWRGQFVAMYYEVFLPQSAMEPCLLFHEGVHWCELTIHTNSQGHTMAIITFHPQELRQGRETVMEFFIKGPGVVCDLTSLYFQESTMTHCSHQKSPFQLLFGKPHIFEELLGLKIDISPDAFFQINTAGAEMLYWSVGKLSGVNSNIILLDIWEIAAVIGLSLAQYTSQVLAIELMVQAVGDARWTAAFNGIMNCVFHAGQPEKISALLKSKEGELIVAVVNPAQAGLYYQVYQAINSRAIHTLIFISCKTYGETTRNIIE
ncbi:LOW QUALITY PROTEIN: tRNA (uracil-5-)-methyltransferase homolog B [Glossophaga mutica]